MEGYGVCEPSKAGKIELGYWAIRGLAAPLRMMLEHSGLEYSEFQIKEAGQWFGAKKDEILKLNPLANLPYLVDGDKCVCQTNAIFVYLGDRTGLNGSNAAEKLMTLQMLEEIYDLRNRVIELVYPFKEVCRDQAEHDAKVKKHLEVGAKGNYGKLNNVVKGPFIFGNAISTADFHLFEMLDQHEKMADNAKASKILSEYPKLAALHAAVKALPTLQKYFASDSYKLPLNNPIAKTYQK